MTNQRLDIQNRFILFNFQAGKPFASFLPGIAGTLGIPMWVFYVNRGQAVTSFGIENKNHPIMEYQPANKAYQTTPLTGFRTFVRIERSGLSHFYEPFALAGGAGAYRKMMAGLNDLLIRDTQVSHGLETEVCYFLLPGEKFAGLVRQVTLKNIGVERISMEVLDGMPVVIPYGISNFFLKEMNRTMEAWMEVFHLDTGIPYYHVRASVEDSAEVARIQAGHFALAFVEQNGASRLLSPLVDPVVVFGRDTSLQFPEGFQRQPLSELLSQRQVTCGRTPCGLFAWEGSLEPGGSVTLNSVYGFVNNHALILENSARLLKPGFLEEKHLQALKLTQELTDHLATHTSDPLFDAYSRQTFLDNVLRGGWPVTFGEGDRKTVFHIYSRTHGDIERDYNFFSLAPEFYSQGNGAYRDINQNRRCDVLLNPQVGDFNIRTFMSLIQADGYNPLAIQGSSFTLSRDYQIELLNLFPHIEPLQGLLSRSFTPGQLLRAMQDLTEDIGVSQEGFLAEVLSRAEQLIEALFGEGYWIDHWTYNLDLIESFLAIYPEKKETLLFEQADLPFYDSPGIVQPRSRKYLLSNGRPLQFGSVVEDEEKESLIASRTTQAHWVRTRHGRGEIYRTTLFSKLVLLALLKFSTLDPWGMGVEMEAGKPGWYDALNGLPGLFGSGMSETYELQRLLSFLREAIRSRKKGVVRLPKEAYELFKQVAACLKVWQESQAVDKQHRYWEAVSTARESYRERIRLGLDGQERSISLTRLDLILARFQTKVTSGIEQAVALNEGLPPTYFTYQVKEYEGILDPNGKPTLSPDGRPLIRALFFEPQVLPLFLEGMVRAMKILPPGEPARKLYQQVKASGLFDQKLKMYKVNASLVNQPAEIGRARSFPPGWLENESIWLHMEYKYLLEVLKAGLYQEFFADLRQTLVPFLNLEEYGRSLLENSSFLASSAFPDETMHGTGYVARLSGSTAEFLSIWCLIMAGEQPFNLIKGQLCLELRPKIPGWLFDEHGQVSFKFLGGCDVIYHNPKHKDTYAPRTRPHSTLLYLQNGQQVELAGSLICAPYADQVRAGQIHKIEVFF